MDAAHLRLIARAPSPVVVVVIDQMTLRTLRLILLVSVLGLHIRDVTKTPRLPQQPLILVLAVVQHQVHV